MFSEIYCNYSQPPMIIAVYFFGVTALLENVKHEKNSSVWSNKIPHAITFLKWRVQRNFKVVNKNKNPCAGYNRINNEDTKWIQRYRSSQLGFTCFKSTKEVQEKGVKCVKVISKNTRTTSSTSDEQRPFFNVSIVDLNK